MNVKLKTVLLMAVIAGTLSCNTITSKKATEKMDTASNVADIHDIELNLFDGLSFKGWHPYNRPADAIKNWTIIDSALVCLGSAADAHGGDIVTNSEYENFELDFQWKVDAGSNSGVMYHVVEDSIYKAPYETGPEYQIIDDAGFPGKLEAWQQTGADYAMHPANSKKKLMPVGEWNSSKIIYNNGHVEHWLNGEQIVAFEAGSGDWVKKRAAGKWKDYPSYGTAKKGKIALQDHGNKAYFRNIVIKEL